MPTGGSSFAALLRTLRERALLTQEQLADRTGLTARTIRRLEAHGSHQPRSESVRLLADALGLADPERAELTAAARRPDLSPTGAPSQLPADIPGFVGRVDQLHHLDKLLTNDGSPTVVTISGTAGVGKTALAVHWAHRVADRFPDGQLYLNLHGYDPASPPTPPHAATRRVLDMFGIPPRRIPVDPEAQTLLYRSQLAGRRILVILDNARDAAQIRPLLPGTPGCLAVVTSRDSLTGLVAADGADPLTLDVMSAVEAWDMLVRRLGAGRVSAEPDAVDEIIIGCARLPLALAIAAARAAARPDMPLADFIAELRDLDAFETGDAATTVRAVLSWSYQCLDAAAARLFRLLGQHPGPDISLAAAAGLVDEQVDATRRSLATLTRAHLLAEHTASRYAAHDLLRAYAAEQAHAIDHADERRAARIRMLDHYLHTAHAADTRLDSSRRRLTLSKPTAGANPTPIADNDTALAWFTAEYPNLLAVVDIAVDTGHDAHAWQLAWTLSTFMERQGHWRDRVAVQRIAVAAAQRLGDLPGLARSHNGLGLAHSMAGEFDDACTHFTHALHRYDELRDDVGRARVQLNLGFVAERRGHFQEALHHAREALGSARHAADPGGQADALNNIGWYHAQLGEYDNAITHCRQALALHHHSGDRHGEADAWDSLGFAEHHLGRHRQAIDAYQEALNRYRSVGDRHNVADVLTQLGDIHYAAADHVAARRAWQEALAMIEDLDHPGADQLRTKLKHVDQAGSAGDLVDRHRAT